MSEEKKFKFDNGKGQLMPNAEDWIKENPSRPTHWGKLTIPDGCEAGDVLKLSAWKGTSKAGNPILKISAEKDGFMETVTTTENTNNENDPF